MDEKFTKLVEVVMNKKGIDREEAEKYVKLMLEKAKKIKEEVISGLDTIEAVVFSGRIVDKFANVIREIDRELAERGEEKVLFSGKIKIEGDKLYHIDYRKYINDRENKFYGRVIEELSDEERYTTNVMGVVKIDGKWELIQFIIRGKHNLEVGKKHEFVGRMGSSGVFLSIEAKEVEEDVSEEEWKSIFEDLRKSDYFVDISLLKERYEEFLIKRTEGMRGMVVLNGVIVDVEKSLMNEGGWLVISNLIDNVIVSVDKDDFLKEVGSSVIVVGNMFERGNEEEKKVVVKGYLVKEIDEIELNGNTDKKIEEKEINIEKEKEVEDKLKELEEMFVWALLPSNLHQKLKQ